MRWEDSEHQQMEHRKRLAKNQLAVAASKRQGAAAEQRYREKKCRRTGPHIYTEPVAPGEGMICDDLYACVGCGKMSKRRST